MTAALRERSRQAPPASRLATCTIGCAAVPSTCSPTLTMRFTTWPAIGERTSARSSWRPTVLRVAFACSRAACRLRDCHARVLHLLAGGDAAREQLLVALQVQPRVLELCLRLLPGGLRLPLLILNRARIDAGDHLSLPHRVAFCDRHGVHPSGDQCAHLARPRWGGQRSFRAPRGRRSPSHGSP